MGSHSYGEPRVWEAMVIGVHRCGKLQFMGIHSYGKPWLWEVMVMYGEPQLWGATVKGSHSYEDPGTSNSFLQVLKVRTGWATLFQTDFLNAE